MDIPWLQRCAWESFESKAATKDDNLMDSPFSFSPSSCAVIRELICVAAVRRHDVRIWKFNPWRPELRNFGGPAIFAETWSKPASENGQRTFIVEKNGNSPPPPPLLTTSHQIIPSHHMSPHLSPHVTTPPPHPTTPHNISMTAPEIKWGTHPTQLPLPTKHVAEDYQKKIKVQVKSSFTKRNSVDTRNQHRTTKGNMWGFKLVSRKTQQGSALPAQRARQAN